MPEFAKPLSLFGTILYEHRSSKSPTVPLVQIRKVFCLAGFSAVVWPVIAPSFTNHSFGCPSHPLRSLPLKIDSKPGSAAEADQIEPAESAQTSAALNVHCLFIKICDPNS